MSVCDTSSGSDKEGSPHRRQEAVCSWHSGLSSPRGSRALMGWRGPHAAFWASASAQPGIRFPVLGAGLQRSLICDLQMNGTRPGTVSTKLSPWDKSSHSAHRVDLSTV